MPQPVPVSLLDDNSRQDTNSSAVVLSSSEHIADEKISGTKESISNNDDGHFKQLLIQQQQQEGANSANQISDTHNADSADQQQQAANLTQATNGTSKTKLDGLKNRIIQRPPPLILNKVSNFYNNSNQTDQNYSTNQSNYHNLNSINNSASVATNKITESLTTGHNNSNKNTQQQPNNNNNNAVSKTNYNTNNVNPSNMANQKFWASLNQNAALRNKIESNNNTSINKRISADYSHFGQTNGSTNNIDSTNNLGADLIINTHRNSASTFHKQSSLSNYQKLNFSSRPAQSESNYAFTTNGNHESNTIVEPHNQQDQHDSLGESIGVGIANPIQSKPIELSNNSEPDDAGGGNSENGGNLIGVDNITPPASYSHLRNSQGSISNIETPASANSSRPRSNNPFLALDDERDDAEIASTHENDNLDGGKQINNFSKRPASFIAATDASTYSSRKLLLQQQQQQQQQQQHQANIFDSSDNSDVLQERFQNLHIDSKSSLQHMLHQDQQHATSVAPFFNQLDMMAVNQQQKHGLVEGGDASINSIYGTRRQVQQQVPQINYQLPPQQSHQNSIYGIYNQSNGNQNLSPYHHQHAINVDSESTVCEPPPSATMQLPKWTDAIYHLSNAILDSNSVAGGAENGQFIYIVESGDIVLELDYVKVSGFTLVEFNELLDVKPVHLLSAVQTKHSHGLTTDLKQFLSSSFMKDSIDKRLQDSIRENIYRRTVPCTTRPPREGEVDKVDYHFLSKEQFIEMNNRDMLLECGIFGGHYYGTMRPFCDLNSLNNSIYGSLHMRNVSQELSQPLDVNQSIGIYNLENETTPISLANQFVPITQHLKSESDNPLYENYESLRMYQIQAELNQQQQPIYKMTPPTLESNMIPMNQRSLPPIIDESHLRPSSIVAVDSEALPYGWERVIDRTHGTYYIDHNTQRTQYERPYEIELIKGVMGFGFTLVEAADGVLLVRSIIPGGPAHQNGLIRPGDILISAFGKPVYNLQHTEIARLFSQFAVGDRIRLTFARSNLMFDANFVPDEYLYSNGTNGDLAIAVNSNYFNQFDRNLIETHGNIAMEDLSEEYEEHIIELDKGNAESNWGIRLIGGSEVGRAISIGSIIFGGVAAKNGQLKSGDEIISIDGIDVLGSTHQHVVRLISACSNKATLRIRRKKFADACEVVLTRSMDEGFGFVIISSGNCALIGKIMKGSPADRCQQLHVRDRIIAVNGRLITPNMQHPEIVNMIKRCGSELRLSIIPANSYSVELIKNAQNDNFGFGIKGGSEYDTPLYILRVAPDGLARDSLNVGDQIIEINGFSTVGMTHQQAASIIKYSPVVKLKLRRNYMTPPNLLVDSPKALQKFNQVTAEMKTVNQNPSLSYLQEQTINTMSSKTFA